MKSILLRITRRGWDGLLRPTIRLPADFPLTGSRLGTAYLSATACFFAGSFLPVALLLAFVFFGIQYLPPTTIAPVMDALFTPRGELTINALIALCVVSFACGFGAELWYLRRYLAKQGHKLSQVIGLSLASLQAKSRLGTLWALLWRVGLAYGIWYGFEHLVSLFVSGPEQPTMEMVRRLSGGNLWAFFVLAAVVAPVLEEIVFRGFLFQSLRATFRRNKPEDEGHRSGLRRLMHNAYARVLRFTSKTPARADLLAVVISGSIFSLEHLQFQPVTMLMLMLMGCYLAEIYRRTGTLWCGILLHALNNGLAVAIIALSK